jgi:Adenylate and Guanylate cyclase catalytic domain
MAVFGAPVAHGDDAERAVRAGLRVLEAIEELNREHPELDLTVRAAVNTGEAIVDARSQPDTSEGLAHGDVVNTASRMQTGAPARDADRRRGDLSGHADRHRIPADRTCRGEGQGEPLAAWQAMGTLTGPSGRGGSLRKGRRHPSSVRRAPGARASGTVAWGRTGDGDPELRVTPRPARLAAGTNVLPV